jgi:4-amino-4-deoxychorismate lyase
VKDGKAYGLDFHLDRFLDSAKKCRIQSYADKESLRQIILETLAASQRRDGIYCRFWMSAGRGDFSVSPINCKGSTFYCAVHEYVSPLLERGIHERTVSVPLKSPNLATVKTTNYLINALAAMEGQEKGGTLGLQCDANGNIAECSIGSVAFVFKDGVLRTPKIEKILRSTTLMRASELWKKGNLPLIDFVFADIPRDQINDAVEAIGFGGGKASAIVNIDGKDIGDGAVGPVCRGLQHLLSTDAAEGDFVDLIPYT